MNTDRAARAFEDFTGRKPTRKRRVELDGRDVAGWELGPVLGVGYEATRDGETARYFHEFKKSARPRLVARDDGRQLYFEGGRYKVTDRGIVDMPALFVVNPSPRKGKTPMAARRRKNGRFVKSHGAARPVVVVQNPSPRKRKRKAAAHTSHRSTKRRYRRNPSSRMGTGKLMNMLTGAAGIGLGAVGAELITGYLPLPPSMKTGTMKHVTKGLVGIAAGVVVGKLLKQPRLGKYIAAGACAIAVHDVAKELIVANAPSVRFGQFVPPMGLGYAAPGEMVSMGEFVPAFGDASSGGETSFRA